MSVTDRILEANATEICVDCS